MWLSINCSFVLNKQSGNEINNFDTFIEIANGNGIDETKEDDSRFIYDAEDNIQFSLPTMYVMEQIKAFINGLGYKWEIK